MEKDEDFSAATGLLQSLHCLCCPMTLSHCFFDISHLAFLIDVFCNLMFVIDPAKPPLPQDIPNTGEHHECEVSRHLSITHTKIVLLFLPRNLGWYNHI